MTKSNNIIMKLLSITVLLVAMVSCNEPVDGTYVRSKTWSYDGGFKIGKGDFVLFDDKEKLLDLKGDTIYYEGKPRAIIESVNKKAFIMKVKSIDGKEAGTYRNPEESLE